MTTQNSTYPLDRKIDAARYHRGEPINEKDPDGEPTRRAGYQVDAKILDLLTRDELMKIIRDRLGATLDLVHWTTNADGDTVDELVIEPSETIWDPEYENLIDGT